jgi:predicted phosphodiesterase
VNPYTHKLEVADGDVIGLLSDIHVPYHDAAAVRLAIECMEREGVNKVILNGDIADSGPASRHPKKQAQEILRWGTLANSVDPGRWIFEWARTREAHYMLGNHEKWVENQIETDPALADTATAVGLLGLPEDGDGWRVYASTDRLRFGSCVIEHGHGIFPSGSGGTNPGSRIKSVAPDQTTNIGHLHRKFAMFWTTFDHNEVLRTHAAIGNGHLSKPEAHEDYAGHYPGWQQSFELIRVWMDGKTPRYTIDQPEIFRDRRGRPVFEYNGKVYR